ncbi:MAG: phage Gp37/Gp68 family protein [Chloroflexi bacterium]|nr:phage Gp37/Gp68 family protein [Chloroflexota bacterium]
MGYYSRIEWTDATWNPVSGCSKVSPGCDHCYAERLTNRFGGDFNVVLARPERLNQPLGWAAPRRVFVCSMADLFHPSISLSFVERVFDIMGTARQHLFQILTKRPGRMAYFAQHHMSGPWPTNVWAGTSVESSKYLPRLRVLGRVPAPVLFVSAEPLLSPLDLRPYLACPECDDGRCLGLGTGVLHCASCGGKDAGRLSWVIVGGESGSEPRPTQIEWVRDLRDQCVAARTRFFFKQWGEYDASGSRVGRARAGRRLDGIEWNECPEGPTAHDDRRLNATERRTAPLVSAALTP